MFEAIFEFFGTIIGAVFRSIFSMLAGAFELIGGFEVIGTFICLIIELFLWFILGLFELIASLCQFRRPKKVRKPTIWRPKKNAQA